MCGINRCFIDLFLLWWNVYDVFFGSVSKWDLRGINQAYFWMKSASVLKEMFQKDFLGRVWILNRVLACGKNGRRCYISLKILKIDCHVQILRFSKDACWNKIKKKFTQRIVITFYILRNSTHLQFLINNISYCP